MMLHYSQAVMSHHNAYTDIILMSHYLIQLLYGCCCLPQRVGKCLFGITVASVLIMLPCLVTDL